MDIDMKFYLCRLCPSYKVVEHQAHNLEIEGLNPASGTGGITYFVFICEAVEKIS